MPTKVIRNEIFEICAEEILSTLKRYYHFKDQEQIVRNLKGKIYEGIMIARRPKETSKDMYDLYFKNREDEYKALLNSLRFLRPVSIIPGDWFSFCYAVEKEKRKMMDLHEEYQVLYKEYFTFVPKTIDNETVWSEIVAFIKTLPKVHNALYELNERTNDYIHFKIPGDIQFFIITADSLVVHYRDKNNGPAIRGAIEKIYGDAGIQLVREFRIKSGFDLFLETPEGKKVCKSHSELIARVVAQHVWEYREAIVKWPVEKLAKFLKEYIENVSKWGVKQITDRIESRQIIEEEKQ